MIRYACPDTPFSEDVTDAFRLATQWKAAQIGSVIGPKQGATLQGCEVPIDVINEAKKSLDAFCILSRPSTSPPHQLGAVASFLKLTRAAAAPTSAPRRGRGRAAGQWLFGRAHCRAAAEGRRPLRLSSLPKRPRPGRWTDGAKIARVRSCRSDLNWSASPREIAADFFFFSIERRVWKDRNA